MFKKLESVLERYEKLNILSGDATLLADTNEWKKVVKELAEITPTAEKYAEYKKLTNALQLAKAELESESDKEMRELLFAEVEECENAIQVVADELKILLLPKDPNDERNVIIEIRAGAGGEEAALFAYKLYRMYVKYAERNRWKAEEIDSNETELGGIKEVTFSISGSGAYSRLKYESGVHRVQRVPETESQGRIHTSTATVAVLPEAEDVEVNIEEKDIKIDTCRSSGAGGQKVNKTESCIRITHFPTGIVVTCQDERSQTQNKERAMSVLKSRLYDYYSRKYESEYAENRKSQIGTGDRSERIRTYNFPQGRITDHRIGFTTHTIETFMEGDIDNVVDALAIADREALLAKSSGQED